jgi:hypothetical protein
VQFHFVMKVIISSLSLIFCCCIYSNHINFTAQRNTLDVNYIKQEDHLVYYSNCDSQEQLAISIHAVAEVKSLKSSKVKL